MRIVQRRGPCLALSLTVALIGSFVLSACGASGYHPAARAVGTGGTLTVAWGGSIDNLDPAITGAQSIVSLSVNIFQTLLWETPAGKLTPDLATSWTTSNSGKTYTFKLRKGVTFQDGTPFNAAAVVANIQFIEAKSTESVAALGDLGTCSSATALSTYTVAINCTTAYVPILYHLSQPELAMQSPTAIRKYRSNLQFHLVGTGPFEFVKYTPNSSIVEKRYAKFNWAPPALHHNGPTKIANLVFDLVPNDGSRISELESGQANLIESTPTAFYNKLGHNRSYRNLAVPISGMGIYMPFDVAKFPTNSTAVRQAIAYFINKQAVEKTALQDAYPVLNTPLEPGILAYDSKLTKYNFDPSKGDSILSANGWHKSAGIWTKNGRPLSIVLNALSGSNYPLILQAVQSQLRTAGLEVTIVTETAIPWENVNATSGENLTVLEFASNDPAMLLEFDVPGQYFDSWTKINIPALTKLLEDGQSTTVTAQRVTDYDQAQELIMKDALEIPFDINDDLLTMSSKVSGVTYEGGGNDFFYEVKIAK
jgi:peptide/nickel transport system substrate-binding protein